MNFTLLIGIIGSVFGFFATYLILLRIIKQNHIPHIFFFILIFCLSWILLVNSLNESGLIFEYPHLFRTAIPLAFCLGPAGYLYIRFFLKKKEKFRYYQYLHFLPTLIVIVDLFPFLIKSTPEKQEIIRQYLHNTNTILSWNEGNFISMWVMWLVSLHILIYMALSILKLYRNSRSAKDTNESRLPDGQLKWLISIVVCVSLIALLFLWSLASKSAYIFAFNTFSVFLAINYLAFIFLLFHKPNILYGVKTPGPERLSEPKYIPLQKNQIKNYCTNVLKYLEDEKPFLLHKYTMDELAKSLGISKSHLSIVINKGLGMKYNDLINKVRIEYLMQNYAKINHKNLTLEGIADSIGFNSRTTFLHSVKKFTGLTPSELVKNLEEKKNLEYKKL